MEFEIVNSHGEVVYKGVINPKAEKAARQAKRMRVHEKLIKEGYFRKNY